MAGAAWASDDAVVRAMRLYEQHHYEEAARTLQADLPALNPTSRAAAYLTLGMIYLGNAELHRGLRAARAGASLQGHRRGQSGSESLPGQERASGGRAVGDRRHRRSGSPGRARS